MCKQQGPLLTDKEFFECGINADISSLEALKDALGCGDYKTCRKIFAEYIRGTLDADTFFSRLHYSDNFDEENVIRKAELAMRHIMTACQIPHDFKGECVDWFSNPTFNGYQEWTWQLNRHAELLTLARAYRTTGDERYAEECCALFDSWVKQATRYSLDDNNSEALCWRSIECGIRMSVVWPEVIYSILPSNACNDDIIVDFFKSIYEHALLLRQFHASLGNWLIMEMSGLLHIATLFPFFLKAEEWFGYAIDKLSAELEKQVYPDGFQFELSSGYQQVVIIYYGRVLRLLTGYGKKVPEVFLNTLRKMLHIYIKLMRPNGALPDLNDGSLSSVKGLVEPYIDLFPNDNDLQWAASGGENGMPPDKQSFILSYSGIAVFRTGWAEDDTWLCFDGGPYGAAHQHEDKLNILLHTRGKYVLTEGNNYAYDSSEMRKYVLSTRAHNTVLVDGMEQNRKKTHCWHDDMLTRHSGLQASLSLHVDACRASYDNGYGDEADKTVCHERSVYFVKKLSGLPPFAIIVDRLTASAGIHSYEIQYHLDADKVTTNRLNITAAPLSIIAPTDNECDVSLSVEYGVKEPKWNGWTADSAVQGDFRPIYIAKYILKGQNIRFATLLLPMDDSKGLIVGLEGSNQIEDTKLCVKLADGRELNIDENEWLERKM